jgi:hypothetical protein
MRRLITLVLTIGLALVPTMDGQSRSKSARLPADAWSDSGILSDTEGFDLRPYLAEIERATSRSWLRILPDEVKPPVSRAGTTLIRFQILPNGNIKQGSMILEERAGTVALDRTAWYSIVQSHYSSFPAGYNAGPIDLRIRFRYNGGVASAAQGYRPRPAAITLTYPDEPAR